MELHPFQLPLLMGISKLQEYQISLGFAVMSFIKSLKENIHYARTIIINCIAILQSKLIFAAPALLISLLMVAVHTFCSNFAAPPLFTISNSLFYWASFFPFFEH